MKELRRYIISNFSAMFMSIFFPLFAIASVIFSIKLATYTAVIQLSPFEMFELYLFVLPELFFYTLPVTFFIAAVLSLSKLSNDNEMIVAFSLGIKPSFILKTFFRPAFFLSALLIFDFFVMLPHGRSMSFNFIYQKKSDAKFNISASEFGHKFGDWLVYVGDSDPKKGVLKDIYLFHKDKDQELFLSGKSAEVINNDGILTLQINRGEGYSYSKEKLIQVEYKTLILNNALNTEVREYRDTISFWLSEDRHKQKKSMFIISSLIALFPLMSVFMIVAIGVVHERHQKGRSYLYIFLSIALFYGPVVALEPILSFYTIPVVAFFWTLAAYYVYKNKITKRF